MSKYPFYHECPGHIGSGSKTVTNVEYIKVIL